jgi:hypothetical protein
MDKGFTIPPFEKGGKGDLKTYLVGWATPIKLSIGMLHVK